MKTIQRFKLIYSIKLVLLALLLAACSSDDNTPPIQNQSITSANFESITSYSDNGYTNIEFGAITNNFFEPIIKVENYNSSFNYTIKIKGDYLDNEYEVDLTFDEINDDGETLLKFDKADFDAVPDTYQAYIYEEESDTEIKIDNKPDQGTRPYFIYDADHGDYLYSLFFKTSDSDYTIPTSINTSGTVFVTYPSVGNFSSGLNLEMIVYDTSFNELGRLDLQSTGGTGYTKIFYGSDLTFVTVSGDYIFQIKGVPNTSNSSYTPRESTFKTMTVNVD